MKGGNKVSYSKIILTEDDKNGTGELTAVGVELLKGRILRLDIGSKE